MGKNYKMTSSERQQLIRTTLQDRTTPVTASVFAKEANVSRQVIVQDVSILKAKNEPIIATSQGYLYLKEKAEDIKRKTIAVDHTPEDTLEELYLIVDHGVTVKDVHIDHPVYGDITASILVSNRREVDVFHEKLNHPDTVHLSALTNGLHLHTLEADSLDKIEAACKELEEAGILVKG